jgi:tetratricopeptide (TPR) repeat protein
VAPSDLASMGSIADISARLLLWSKRATGGLTRVEFSSEFSRQRVIDRLKSELAQQQIPFAEIQLPTYREPMEIVNYLLAELDKQTNGVVSINGFSIAFRTGVPLEDAMYALNFNRERFADRPLRQIWWMTPAFYDAAQFAMPDLMSWFNPRLRLTEAVVGNPPESMMTGGTANIDDAHQRAEYLIERFERGNQAGASADNLLKFNLLPALEALAEVNAQKELRDLTSRFEGFFSRLQALDSPDLAKSLDRLGCLYQEQGRYGEAEPLLKKALKLHRQLAGDDHPDVATSLNNLAGLYKSQGRYNEAEPLYEQSLEIREQQLGADHPDVAQNLNNLAELYHCQKDYSEAEPLYIRSLQIMKRKLGADHPDVATILNNLAGLYQNQDRYAEAEPLYEQSLEIREQQLGADHPHVAISLNNLAELYRRQKDYSKAEPLYIRSLKIMERQLGADHPTVATSLNNLALLYHDAQGRYDEAEPLYVRSLAIREQHLGTEHPDVAISLNNLAALYQSQGRYVEAEPLYLRSLFILKQQLGAEHPTTKTIEQNFIVFLSHVIDEGQQSVLSDDPFIQKLIAQIQEERSHTPTPPSD